MNVPKNLQYTKDHEWIRVDGDKAYIGITDYAQNSLGDIVYVDLPSIDDELGYSETFGVVESVKAASDMYMPLSGVVVEINEELEDSPGLINQAPYDNWIIAIDMIDETQLSSLLSASEYLDCISE